jgi:uncharacterized repeat protein (TIGR01451 family)
MTAFMARMTGITALCLRRLFKTGSAVVRLFADVKAAVSSVKSRSRGNIAAGSALYVPGATVRSGGPRPVQVIVLLLALMMPVSLLAVPAGTVITNIAQVDYTIGGTPTFAVSNTVSFTTTIIGTTSTLELYRYAPSSPAISVTVQLTDYFDTTSGTFVTAGPPVDPGTGLISVGGPVPLAPETVFTVDDPVFVILTDPDPNVNPAVADTLTVTLTRVSTGIEEIIVLVETGPDTGVFTGYMQSGPLPEFEYDGTLDADPGTQVDVDYIDPTDPGDTSSVTAAFDPSGVLFVNKSAGKSSVGIGEVLDFTVTVENNSGSTLLGVDLSDTLPVGFEYKPGSTLIDGLPAPDPAVSTDGRLLTWSLGDIPAGTVVEVYYVTGVTAGARSGTAVNAVSALSGAVTSNTALSRVTVTEDLYTAGTFIVGQVNTGPCDQQTGKGLEGVRIYLEDGTYTVTDEHGRYHFEGVSPGSHVVQVDLETIPEWYEIIDCEDDTRSAGKAYSRFVDLQEGTLWRVDFSVKLKPREDGKAFLELRSAADEAGVKYSATLSGEAVPLRNVKFIVQLPEGVEYKPGSTRLEGEPYADPLIRGPVLIWDMGSAPGNWERGVTFDTRVREGWDWSRSGTLTRDDALRALASGEFTDKQIDGRMAEVLSRASMSFDTPDAVNQKTPVIENLLMRVSEEEVTSSKKFLFRPRFASFSDRLTDGDKAALDVLTRKFEPDTIALITVTGHTDSVPIALGSRDVFADNYELSMVRARSVAAYLAEVFGLPDDKFAFEGKGPDEPLATNANAEGRATNRRVEVGVVTRAVNRRTSLEPIKDIASTRVDILGLRPGQSWSDGSAEIEEKVSAHIQPDLTRELGWLESESGELRFAMPAKGHLPHLPGIKVAVVHSAGDKVKLFKNGVEVNPLKFDSTTRNKRGTAAMSYWRGVLLTEGDNSLEAVSYTKGGQETGRVKRQIHYSSPPVRMELVKEMSSLLADGRTPPVIAVRLTDSMGYPARYGILGQFSVDGPHMSLEHAREHSDNPVKGISRSFSSFRIEEDGVALLRLKPTSRTGDARVRLNLSGGWQDLTVQLAPEYRDWILVGLVEGTAGYNTVSGNKESLEDAGGEDKLYTDGRAALYAKGQIRGEYLLTLAYDTAKEKPVGGGQFSQAIDPDTYYTLYGDGSQQDHDSPSTSKLYVKMERDSFYALFGDYDTGMTVTELGRYNRSMTGLKSEMSGERFSYNLFASETGQAYVRDEIPGDGTSGLYRLSFDPIVTNSDKVRIEVRDRFQSHIIVSTTELTRHTDYNIDFVDGTIYFKSPVPQRDSSFNPVYIVAEYETDDPDADAITFGGRGAYQVSEQVEAGLTVVYEDRGLASGDLTGADVTVELGSGTTITAELAASTNDDGVTETDGDAYLLELEHEGERLEAKAYLREMDQEFGLGHQNVSERGMRKTGLDVAYDLTGRTTVTGAVLDQVNMDTDAERDVYEAGIEYSGKQVSYDLGFRQASDVDSTGVKEDSSQVTAGAEWVSSDSRLVLDASHDQSLGDNDNTDYPTRTLLGAEYRLTDKASLYAEQEFTSGESITTSASRAGLKARPWAGAEATGDVVSETMENGQRLYASLGLTQDWQVTESWRLSASAERAETMDEPAVPSEPLNPDAPPASGGEDYTAVSLGTENKFGAWEFNARLEHRDSESSEKDGVITSLYGEPGEGIGLSAALQRFETTSDTAADTLASDLALGFVYRPLGSSWTLLEKLEFITEEETGGAVDTVSNRTVNNFNANYKPGSSYQLAFQYGYKDVEETLGATDYKDTLQLFGFETRYDLTSSWDLGARALLFTSAETGKEARGLGLSAGWSFAEDMWLSFGYNFDGFVDEDFSDGDYTAAGAFVKFRMKFDQADLKALLD